MSGEFESEGRRFPAWLRRGAVGFLVIAGAAATSLAAGFVFRRLDDLPEGLERTIFGLGVTAIAVALSPEISTTRMFLDILLALPGIFLVVLAVRRLPLPPAAACGNEMYGGAP